MQDTKTPTSKRRLQPKAVAWVRLEQDEKAKMELLAQTNHMTPAEYLRLVVKTAVAQEWSFKPQITSTPNA